MTTSGPRYDKTWFPISWRWRLSLLSPPDWGGVRLPTFCPGRTFASFGLKFNPKLANVLYYTKNTIICIKNTWKGWRLPVLRAAKCWQTSLFSKFVFEDGFLHISFGLPGPLRTAFELKHWSEDVEKSAGCDCATGKCYQLAKKYKKHIILVRNFQKNPTKSYLGPQIPKNLKKTVRTKIVHTSGTFVAKHLKNVQKII